MKEGVGLLKLNELYGDIKAYKFVSTCCFWYILCESDCEQVKINLEWYEPWGGVYLIAIDWLCMLDDLVKCIAEASVMCILVWKM